MGTIKDVYDILKDLRSLAKEANNQPMIELAVSIQDNLFDIKDEMQNLKEENRELKAKITKVENENRQLSEQLRDYNSTKEQLEQYTKEDLSLAFEDTKFKLHFTENVIFITSSTVIHKKVLEFGLDEIFKVISLQLTSPVYLDKYEDAFSGLCQGYHVDEQDALSLKAQFLALGLIEILTDKKNQEMIKLTPKGLSEMKKLNTIKQGDKNNG